MRQQQADHSEDEKRVLQLETSNQSTNPEVRDQLGGGTAAEHGHKIAWKDTTNKIAIRIIS